MDLNNIVLLFILIGFNLLFYKYFIIVLNKNYPKFLIDDQLNKPQAFHESPISTAGGTCMLFSLIVVYFYFLLFKNIIFLEYLTFCTLIFFIGLTDDLKINVKKIINIRIPKNNKLAKLVF